MDNDGTSLGWGFIALFRGITKVKYIRNIPTKTPTKNISKYFITSPLGDRD